MHTPSKRSSSLFTILQPLGTLSLAFASLPRQNSRLFFGALKTVANIKSAEKRARQNIKRRAANMAARSRMRTAVKSAAAAVKAGDKNAAEQVKAAVPVLDSMVNKGLVHRNKAARHKRQLAARLKAQAGK